MAGEVEELKGLLPNTDLAIYTDDEPKLRFAINYAITQVNLLRNYVGEDYEPRYRNNVIQCAIDYLENIGGTELAGYGQNGINGTRRDRPSWTIGIVPIARRIRNATTP